MRHVEVLDTKHHGEVLQLVRSKGLCEDVDNLPIGTNILEFDSTAQDPLVHKVVMHFYVLCASMEYGVHG